MSEIFALMDVGDMNFVKRNVHACQGIPYGGTGMGIGTGIEQYKISAAPSLLNTVDNVSFMIGLIHFELYIQ